VFILISQELIAKHSLVNGYLAGSPTLEERNSYLIQSMNYQQNKLQDINEENLLRKI